MLAKQTFQSSLKMLLPATFYSILVAFLSSLDRPTTLVTHLCAQPGQLVEFNSVLTLRHPILIRHLTCLAQLNEENEHQVLVILDLSCKGIESQLSEEINQRNLNFNYRWFLIDLDNIFATQERALNVFTDIEILHSSEIYFFNAQQGDDTFEIKRMYRNSLVTNLIVEPIFEGSLANTSTIKWTRKHHSLVASRLIEPGFEGTLIKGAYPIFNNDSLNHLTDYIDPHIDSLTKINYFLTNTMIRFLNASVHYTVTDGWGYYDNVTNEFNGLTGMFIKKEVDITANVWFASLMRFDYVQFISMTCPSELKILYQAPKLTMTDNVFLLPFQWVSFLYEIDWCSLYLNRLTFLKFT